MNWIKKYKLPATEVIQFNGHLYIELGDLWQVFFTKLSIQLKTNTSTYVYSTKSYQNLYLSGCLFPRQNLLILWKNIIVYLLQELTTYHGVISKFWWLMTNTSQIVRSESDELRLFFFSFSFFLYFPLFIFLLLIEDKW